MRAVKYGVTRHQVLGLEAVLATGEVIRTGGKFVKATTGYDLTQLIIGSEGTLALVTEATLSCTRGSPTRPPCSPRSPPSTRSPPRSRRSWRSGVGPLILEYIDLLTMAAATAHVRPRARHPRGGQGHRARLPRRRAGETARRPARGGRQRSWPSCSPSSGALDVYVLPPGAGRRADRGPREGVLGGQGQRRRRHHRHGRAPGRDPRVPGRGAARSPPSTGSLDRRLRPRRRRQRAPVGVPGRRRRCAARSCATLLRGRAWRSAARSRASTASAPRRRRTSSSSRTRPSSTSCAASRRRSTPHGILNPGTIFD